jgi:fatty-acyl-CoA synthase
MLGLMQRQQLLISDILAHAARFHRDAAIVSRRADGSCARIDYPQLARRAAQLAHALASLGVTAGTRVGTLAWNDHRHLEIYFAAAGSGAICHTINPRLFEEQIAYIVADAGDRVIFADQEFLPVLDAIGDDLRAAGVQAIVALDATTPADFLGGIRLVSYEALLDGQPEAFSWPALDEEAAALLCYTSGTTGMPKGVLYSHRATVLHAYAIALPDVFSLRAVDRVMPIVPMYHVNAWGLPFSAALVGASQILPGPRPTPEAILDLVERHGVTFGAAVPTVWQGLRDALERRGAPQLPRLRIISGGAACPVSLAREMTERFGIQVNHAWGMTEMSPVGLCNMPKPENEDWPRARWLEHQRKQGRPVFGVDLRVVDADGRDVPDDGQSYGELLVRGPWIVDRYFNGERALDAEGWFHTGDIVTLDSQGYVEIVDRAKDVIKSGGEWISSIALENLAVAHPAVAEAAVIGAKHGRWDERPVLIVVPADPASAPDRQELLAWFDGKVPRWWVPDEVVLADSLPRTATGKVLKSELRSRFGDMLLE